MTLTQPSLRAAPLLGIALLAMPLWFSSPCFGAADSELAATFGPLRLVDQVDCGAEDASHPLLESAPGVSRVEDLLGRRCRVLTPSARPGYFAYVLGKGKSLTPGDACVLAIDCPEDRPRTVQIVNRGAETFLGFHTGGALGDCLLGYTQNNNESLTRVPLSGTYQTCQSLFFLHDRFPDIVRQRDGHKRPRRPEDGFHVIVVQPEAADDPLSAGAAIARIRLYQVEKPQSLPARLHLPPAGLPRRYVFSREEMADSNVEGLREKEPALARMDRFFEFKARNARFLGMNAFCTDLLEFGHNQGWDSGDDAWFIRGPDPQRWEKMVRMLAGQGLDVIPYYEYAGSMGLNRQVPSSPLRGPGQPYTHITWSENYHLDVTDPASLADIRRLLDCTVVRHREQVRFIGAWFRNRVSHVPISFSDKCLARFAQEARAGAAVTREQLKADARLLNEYREWWLLKRRAFFADVAGYLREKLGPEAVLLWTNWSNEAGPPLPGGRSVVTDDPATWRKLLADSKEKVQALDLGDLTRGDAYLKAITAWPFTWAEWEWQHAEPRADPEHYRDVPGVLFTYPIHRAYSASRAEDFAAFRGPAGLAVARMAPLNEHRDGGLVGYYLSDVERAGPTCMLTEALAVANGDPRYLAYLHGGTPARGFPAYVRRFYAAFLALPAVPGENCDPACADPRVRVRLFRTEKHGTYIAVVNTDVVPKAVDVTLPLVGPAVSDAATQTRLGEAQATVRDGKIVLHLELDAAELRALHAAP